MTLKYAFSKLCKCCQILHGISSKTYRKKHKLIA